jgi:hypothetical protein
MEGSDQVFSVQQWAQTLLQGATGVQAEQGFLPPALCHPYPFRLPQVLQLQLPHFENMCHLEQGAEVVCSFVCKVPLTI